MMALLAWFDEICRRAGGAPVIMFSLLVLSGCAGVGVMSSDNQMENLHNAHVLFAREDRPLIAERLILQSIAVFKKHGNNIGLGDAYREYAELLDSPSTSGKWKTYYENNGFLDGFTTYDRRAESAAYYYRKALVAYKRAVPDLEANKRYDYLTNDFYNAGHIDALLGNKQGACEAYKRALLAYRENVSANPEAKPYSPTGSIPSLLDSNMRSLGCF